MLLALIINASVVALAVLIHYEMLNLLTQRLPNVPVPHRWLVIMGVFGALFAHLLEVGLFGLAYYGMIQVDGLGTLQGNFTGTLVDCLYFSLTNYTSLGYGDIEPVGHIRFLAGLEALAGLLLITWSASFMFIEMQKFWRNRGPRR